MGEVANEKNLKPLNTRAKSVQRKIQSQGGYAKAEKERKQRALRECAELLLSLPITEVRKFNKLSRMGVPIEGIDNKMALVAAMLMEGQAGNVAAFKELRDLIGEDVGSAEPVVIVDDL